MNKCKQYKQSNGHMLMQLQSNDQSITVNL